MIKFLNNPIFVIGQYRSGTTILQKSIGAHKNVYVTGFESPAFNDFGMIANKFNNNKNGYYRASILMKDNRFRKKIIKLMLETYMGDYFGFRKELGKIRRLNFSPFYYKKWVAKIFPSELEYNGLEYLFPDLKCIYIYRNGISQINSCMSYPLFNHESFENHCKNWVKSIEKFDFLKKRKLALIIKQEKLLEEPSVVYKNIFDYLGLHYDKNCEEFSRKNIVVSSYSKDLSGIDSKSFFQSRKNPWEKWNTFQKETFLSICGDKMNELNYIIPK